MFIPLRNGVVFEIFRQRCLGKTNKPEGRKSVPAWLIRASECDLAQDEFKLIVGQENSDLRAGIYWLIMTP